MALPRRRRVNGDPGATIPRSRRVHGGLSATIPRGRRVNGGLGATNHLQVSGALVFQLIHSVVNTATAQPSFPVVRFLENFGNALLQAVYALGSGIPGFLKRGTEQGVDLNHLLFKCRISINSSHPFQLLGLFFKGLLLLFEHHLVHLHHRCCVVLHSMGSQGIQHGGGIHDLQRNDNLLAVNPRSKCDGLQLSVPCGRSCPPAEYQTDTSLVHGLEHVLGSQING
mmetsp:Transcript_52773/g.115753  ORF Transcript_52773/g.115753 Transcript_52773/m.115753 type:complete len:226 (-) Transcript_52773:830-1507(-)